MILVKGMGKWLGVVGAVCILTSIASAMTTTATIPISADVLASCTAGVTAATLQFSDITSFPTSAQTAQTQIQFTCTSGTTVSSIEMTNGNNFLGGQRRMRGSTNTSNYIPYNIYQPTGALIGPVTASPGLCTTLVAWGSGSNALTWLLPSTTAQFGAAGLTAKINVCGQLPAISTPVLPDVYNDTVTVTVYIF